MELSIGNAAYRLITSENSGEWRAHVVRADTNERFGVEATARTEQDAVARLTRWLEWQHEHTRALEALQQAERAYHRAMAGAAFAASADVAADAGSRTARGQVDEARARLDEVRTRRPSM
jgi:hypothetical protein